MAKVTFTGKTARKLSNPKYIVVTEFLASDSKKLKAIPISSKMYYVIQLHSRRMIMTRQILNVKHLTRLSSQS